MSRHVSLRRCASWRLGLGAAALASAAGSAVAQIKIDPVPGHEYREAIGEKRQVSGHAVVGVRLVGGEIGRTLYVFLPPGHRGTHLRVDIDSPDGAYVGTGLFAANGHAGWAEVALAPVGRSPRSAELPANAKQSLAVSVRLLDSAVGGAGRLLLARWSAPRTWTDPPAPSDEIVLHVNSRRASISLKDQRGDERKCSKVKSSSTVRFDTECLVAIGELRDDASKGVRVLTLIRKEGFAKEEMTVELPRQGTP